MQQAENGYRRQSLGACRRQRRQRDGYPRRDLHPALSREAGNLEEYRHLEKKLNKITTESGRLLTSALLNLLTHFPVSANIILSGDPDKLNHLRGRVKVPTGSTVCERFKRMIRCDSVTDGIYRIAVSVRMREDMIR